MHPALSVIVFTSFSGAGYGLVALVGLWFALGRAPLNGSFGLWSLGFGILLITAGLFSSTAHLGHPERAWRAFSQWRSSWLSREGILAIATYVALALFAFGWIFGDPQRWWVAFAAIGATALAIITVYCTAMIYRSLKPVHQWCNPHVVPVYVVLALMTGALWLDALLRLWGTPDRIVTAIALVAIVAGTALKERYWRFIDTTRGPASPGSATGLGADRDVRLLDPPHTGSNYLLKEMGFQVARKHAVKLRRIALALGFGAPIVLVLAALILSSPLATIAAVLAALSAMIGVLTERWLFFAEAKHTVTLYYGAEAA
jgi:DMSO reductase anchor subunit